MHNAYGALKYQLKFFGSFTVILLLVIFFNLVLLSGILLFIRPQNTGSYMITGQIDAQTYFMIFIVGLLSFKMSFKFLLAHGFSRRLFFRANLAALAAVAVAWTLMVMLLAFVFRLIAPYKMVPELIYKGIGAAGGSLWLGTAFFLLAALGWCIGLIYYRCDSRGKVVVSVAPLVISALIAAIDLRINGAISRGLIRFFLTVMGLSTAMPNPYLGACSMLFLAAALCGCSYLLIRRAQIKD